MDRFAEEVQNLHQQTQQNRYEYLLTELDVCSTTIDFGVTELEIGNREIANREAATASKGVETIERFLRELDSTEHKDLILARLQQLKKALDAFEQKLKL